MKTDFLSALIKVGEEPVSLDDSSTGSKYDEAIKALSTALVPGLTRTNKVPDVSVDSLEEPKPSPPQKYETVDLTKPFTSTRYFRPRVATGNSWAQRKDIPILSNFFDMIDDWKVKSRDDYNRRVQNWMWDQYLKDLKEGKTEKIYWNDITYRWPRQYQGIANVNDYVVRNHSGHLPSWMKEYGMWQNNEPSWGQ